MLVEAGAEINEKGEHGFTPLMEAVGQLNVDAVKELVRLGATAEPNDDGQKPSEYAALSGDADLSSWLRTNGL